MPFMDRILFTYTKSEQTSARKTYTALKTETGETDILVFNCEKI